MMDNQENMVKGMGFCHLQEISPTIYRKIIGYYYKNRTRCCKNCENS